MRALVTGAGGFVGGALARALHARGDDVVTLQRSSVPALERLGIICQRGDLGQRDDVMRAAQGCDVVFHVAAKVGGAGARREFERINVEGTQHVLDACDAAGVRRLVFCSSPSVVSPAVGGGLVDETVPYASRYLADYPRTKAIAEQLVLAAGSHRQGDGGLLACALRPHLVFGPGDTGSLPRVLDRARSGRLRIVGDGHNQVDLTYVDNVVDAHLLAADALAQPHAAASGKAYFITNGEPVALWEWVNDVLVALGWPRIERKVPATVARGVGKGFDLAWSLLGRSDEPPLTEWAAKMMSTSHTFTIENAMRDLGYRPRVSMADGLARTLPWLRERYGTRSDGGSRKT